MSRTEALARERIYIVEQDGRIWGKDVESGQDLFNMYGGVDADRSVSIGGGAELDAALAPAGDLLYLAFHDSLVAVDALSGAELWRLPVEDRINWIGGSGPSTVGVSQDGQRLFVYSSDAPEWQWVQIYSVRNMAKVGDTNPISGNCPAEMKDSPDGRTLYLVCIRFGGVRIIDLETGETVDSIAGQFSGSAVSPDGSLLFAVTTSKRLFTIDMDSREVIADAELDLPSSPSLLRKMVAVSPDGMRLYVGLGREDNDGDSGSQDIHEIAIIDLKNGTTVDVIETAFQFDGKGLAVDADGHLYGVSQPRLVQIDPVTGDLERSFVGMEVRQFLLVQAQ